MDELKNNHYENDNLKIKVHTKIKQCNINSSPNGCYITNDIKNKTELITNNNRNYVHILNMADVQAINNV